MRTVLKFVGEEWNESVLSHDRSRDENGIPFPWLVSADGKRSSIARNWREQLPPHGSA